MATELSPMRRYDLKRKFRGSWKCSADRRRAAAQCLTAAAASRRLAMAETSERVRATLLDGVRYLVEGARLDRLQGRNYPTIPGGRGGDVPKLVRGDLRVMAEAARVGDCVIVGSPDQTDDWWIVVPSGYRADGPEVARIQRVIELEVGGPIEDWLSMTPAEFEGAGFGAEG
jgi:hypothetical protein